MQAAARMNYLFSKLILLSKSNHYAHFPVPEIWRINVSVFFLLRSQGGRKGIVHSDTLLMG